MIIKTVSDFVQRVAAHTAYAAGDAISDSATVPRCLRFRDVFPFKDGCRVWLSKATLVEDQVPTVAGQFVLMLFNGAAPLVDTGAAFDDDAALALVDEYVLGPNNRLIAVITFNTGYSTGLSYFYQYVSPPIALESEGSTDLYGILSAANAYDPSANSGKLNITLTIEQDQ